MFARFTIDMCVNSSNHIAYSKSISAITYLDLYYGDEPKFPCHYKDICKFNPCLNNAKCQASNNSFNCICTDGYKGVFCEEVLGLCDKNPCLNGATCVEKDVETFACVCSFGWSGKICDKVLFDIP